MLAFSVLVAGSFSIGARIANDIDPIALTAARFALAGTILGAVAASSGALARSALRSAWRYLLTGGLFAVYFVLMFEGLKTAAPVSASAVFTLVPVLAAGFGWILLGQVSTGRMQMALAIGAVGALWVIFRADLSALLAFRVGQGEAIYFVGCIAHAVYVPVVARLGRGVPVVAFACFTMLAGCLLLSLFGAPRLAATDWASLPVRVWLGLGYLALFASAVSVSLLQFASLRLKAARVMAYTYLTPSFVILWEISLGAGAPPPALLPGIALSCLALLMLFRPDVSSGV